MDIICSKIEDMADYGKESNARVFSAIIKIVDIESRAKNMVSIISNETWLDKLNVVERISYEARAKQTIEKLVNIIVNRTANQLSEEFGEFLVSESAQTYLEESLSHVKVPLAELFKEKLSGNPGFDFHTQTESELIAFGEAKYSGSGNPHGLALGQIGDFIDNEKDKFELVDLKNFVSDKAIKNFTKGEKAYVAAFSVNGIIPINILNNALKSEKLDKLLSYSEVFIIGVQV